MKVKFLLTLVIIFTSSIYAQLENIKEFPKEYESQETKELTPVWISENEILTFYTNSTLDTIFSRRTTDRGQSWTVQKFEQNVIGHYPFKKIYLTAIKGNNDRIILAWADTTVIIIYSDDKGLSWSPSTLPYPEFFAYCMGFFNMGNGSILFSFRSIQSSYIISYDNGESWSLDNITNLPTLSLPAGTFSISAIDKDSLICIFPRYNVEGYPVYSIASVDGGETWSDTVRIAATNYNGGSTRPNVCSGIDDEQNLWVFFDQFNETGYEGYNQLDVSVFKSSNFGFSWQKMNSFTKYMGSDFLDNISTLDGKYFISFHSSRSSEIDQSFYGIFGESADVITPPVLLNEEVIEANYESNEFIYNALIIDDDAVAQVIVELENGVFVEEMFDDGLHNDSLDGDNIFGNTLPILTPTSILPNYGKRYSLDVNKIKLPLNNKGILADVNYTHSGLLAEFLMYDVKNNVRMDTETALVPVQNSGSVGKYEEGGFIYSGGFWLSGYNGDSLWSNAVSSALLVEDYLPGKVGGDPDDGLNRIYIVNINDKPFGYTWQNWKDAVSLGAEFYDGDGDGIYNPVDKNWNGTWDDTEDMPALLGDETVFCIYNDGIPANQRRWQSEPQGIEVRQTLFASSLPELENVMFIKYSVLNTGSAANEMDSVYFGIWEDGDLGDISDDVVGCDTLLNSGFYYNNAPDLIYGENCPAFFTPILQGPVSHTGENTDIAIVNYGTRFGSTRISGAKNLDMSSHVFFLGGTPNLSDPSNKIEARNFLLGRMRLGEFPNPCSFTFCEVRGGVDCNEVDPHFWASGDPATDVGWINRMNEDHRNLISTGPFQLEKDKPQEIIIAYVMGRGTDYFNSITVARENVRRAIAEYESNFASMTYVSPPPSNPVTDYLLYHNYPNPFNPTTTIRYEIPQDGVVTIKIYDVLGQEVETIVNEFKKANRYEVEFNSFGLASGVYVYRMKVNDFIESKKMVLLR